MNQYTPTSAQLRVQELLTQLPFLHSQLGTGFYKPNFTVAVLAETPVRAKEVLRGAGIDLTRTNQVLYGDILYKELIVGIHIEPCSLSEIRGRSNLFLLVDKNMYSNENYWHHGTPAVNSLMLTLRTTAMALKRSDSALIIPV